MPPVAGRDATTQAVARNDRGGSGVGTTRAVGPHTRHEMQHRIQALR